MRVYIKTWRRYIGIRYLCLSRVENLSKFYFIIISKLNNPQTIFQAKQIVSQGYINKTKFT